MNEIAKRLGCSGSQLSLAWILAQGSDVIAIPGTTKIAHLDENMSSVNIDLSETDLKELNTLFDPSVVYGDR